MGLEDWATERDDGFGLWVRGMTEVVNVATWAEAADVGGAGWGVNGLALRADADFGVVPPTRTLVCRLQT